MVTYRLTVRQVTNDSGMRTAYGVALYRDGICLRAAEDLSPDREAVGRLADLFNAEALDPVHFDQAIEDFLYDGSAG